MKKIILLVFVTFLLSLQAQEKKDTKTVQTPAPTVSTQGIDTIEAEVNPMRPNFGGNLQKKEIKIKEKNKVISRNLLKSNKILYKNGR